MSDNANKSLSVINFISGVKAGRSLTWGFTKSNESKLNVYSLRDTKTISFHDSVIYDVHDDQSTRFSLIPTVNEDKEFEEDVYIDWYDVELSGLWGHHGLETDSWDDDEKPFVNVLENNQTVLTESEESGVLSDRMIYSCCSYLDRCPETKKYVLCKFNLSKKALEDITAISNYHFCQYLDLSHNDLIDITPLGHLPFLMYLDVSHNDIKDILKFRPPLYLTHVNFSFNCVRNILDLTDFWSIVFLDLSHNYIEKIEGLKNLRYLRYLNLSYNKIRTVANLDGMRIQNLDLKHNNIEHFEEGPESGLKTLPFLKHVNVSHNNLKSLRIFRGVEQIQNLMVSNNNILSLVDLYYLREARFLASANFAKNPIAESEQYTMVCLDAMQFLVSLDNEYVSSSYRNTIRTLFTHTPESVAAQQSANLMFMKQLSNPLNENPIFKFSSSPPSLLVLVGPPGSNKHVYTQLLSKNFPKHICLGVSHTTRAMLEYEQNGISYHFISDDEFRKMVRDCRFINISEHLGYKFGLAKSELSRVYNDGILVLHTDLNGALVLRSHGLMPALVLSLPRSAKTHLDWLRSKYYVFHAEHGIVRISNNPHMVKYDLKTSYTETFEDNAAIEGIISEIMEKVLLQICKADWKSKSRNSSSFENCSEQFGCRPKRPSKRMQDVSGLDLWNTDFSEDEKNDSGMDKKKLRAHFNMEKSIYGSDINIDKESEDLQIIRTNEMDEFGKFYPNEEANVTEKKRLEHMAIHMLTTSRSTINTITDSKRIRSDRVLIDDSENIENIFFQRVLTERDEYMDIHWKNPGLFCRVIFTDERGESMSALKEVIHSCVENQSTREPMYNVENDPLYQMKAKRSFIYSDNSSLCKPVKQVKDSAKYASQLLNMP